MMTILLEKSKVPKKIKWLNTSTSQSWLDQAIAHPLEILIDHANCERKAAGAAIQMMFRYLCEPGLAEVLSPLAREELEHFERVLQILKSRGRYLEPLQAPPYGSLLAKNIRKDDGHTNALLWRKRWCALYQAPQGTALAQEGEAYQRYLAASPGGAAAQMLGMRRKGHRA